MTNADALTAANTTRRERAATRTVPAVAAALASLGDTVPPRMLAAAHLRLAHPDLSLRDLAAVADPPMSKDTLASLLRRLLRSANTPRWADS